MQVRYSRCTIWCMLMRFLALTLSNDGVQTCRAQLTLSNDDATGGANDGVRPAGRTWWYSRTARRATSTLSTRPWQVLIVLFRLRKTVFYKNVFSGIRFRVRIAYYT